MSANAAVSLTRFKHPAQKVKRDEMRLAERCINGPRDMSIPADTPSKNGIVHGKVVKSGKCQRCLDVHRNGPTR